MSESTSEDIMDQDFPQPSCIQIPETKEPLTEGQLLGHFRKILIVTGLDCSVVYRSQTESALGRRSLIAKIIAAIIISVVIFRCIVYFTAAGSSMSIQWAESNMCAFMGLHSIACAFCLFGWTKNGFTTKHLNKLNHVKLLRVKENLEIDDYSKIHRKGFIWSGFWFLGVMVHGITAAALQKTIITGSTVIIPLYVIMPVLSLLVCFIVTIAVIYFFLVNCSLSREIEYFNQELESAKNENQLHSISTMLRFCNRQAELIRLVRQANESLGSYATTSPMFVFNACINAVYIASGFNNSLPQALFTILLYNLFSILAITFFTLRPGSNVQFHLSETARILMDSEEFENCQNSEVFKTYQVMINRSLKHDAKLRVLGGIPIYPTTVNIAMFIIPNIGNFLGFVRKVLVAQGINP